MSDSLYYTSKLLNVAAAIQTVTGAVSTAAIPLPALGVSREIHIVSSNRAHVRFGAAGVAAAAAGAGVLLIPVDEPTTIGVPVGTTHFTAIQDTAAGILCIVPVA